MNDGAAIPAKRPSFPTGRARRGMTLTEILVVIVIALLLVGLLAPPVASFMQLEQHKAAKELTLLYGQLHDEAVMRNVTFRVAYDLRQGTYQVEVAEGGVLIFDDADARERFEANEESRYRFMSDEDKATAQATMQAERKSFASVQARYKTQFELPAGAAFGGIYTPQYGEMVGPGDLDEDEPAVVYSYIFANGQAEHTVIHMVDADDPTEGFTIEVEPLSGTVHLRDELVDWRRSYDFVPSEGPDIPSL